jgi:hypothetical protein
MIGSMLALALAAAAFLHAAEPVVLTRAYSHNDYEQPRALSDALDAGFFSVEADCHLRGLELFVAHNGGDIKPGRTLRSLYLDPLLARVKANGGRVHKGGPKGFLLMVEFKSDAEESYPVLRDMLAPYRSMLTRFKDGKVVEGAVTVVITGHKPHDLLRAESDRWAAIDGGFGELDDEHPTLYPTISADWRNSFTWRTGRMDDLERRKLGRYVERARARGRLLRFWAIPDRAEAWELMLTSGVSLINTDKPAQLQDFLLRRVTEDGERALDAAGVAAGGAVFTPSSRP